MSSILVVRQVRWRCLAGAAQALVILIAFSAWAIDPAAAQSLQTYQIEAGDKIGVNVIGQPDLSGESTVDQTGIIRLPIVGDIHAANLTPSELEKRIAHSLEQGYVRNPVVSVKIAEFRPIYVLGMVRTPGLYPYREGLSVLGAIARAGGIGAFENQQSSVLGDLLQAEERVRLLEISRAALLAKRARLIAQQSKSDHIDFPDMSGLVVDPTRMAQVRDGEQRAFDAERKAEQQETEALQQSLPRLEAEIASLKRQMELEQQLRDLNHLLVADYEQLMKSGHARSVTYLEVKREETRINGNIARLRSDSLKAELAIGDVQFKLSELLNGYQRRVMAELRETERLLLELTITLPSAQRTRAARGRQIGLLNSEQVRQPAIVVIRAKGSTNVKGDAAVDFLLQPGDVVQVGSLFPPALDLPLDQIGVPGEKAQGAAPSRTGDAAASHGAVEAARTLN